MKLFKKLRRWLATRYLPEYTRLKLLEEIDRQQERIAELEQALAREKAYSRGILRGARARPVIIQNKEVK